MRKIIAYMLSVFLITLGCGMMSFANNQQQSIEPRWNNAGSIDCAISFDENQSGYAWISVAGKFGVTQIEVSVTVSYQNGSNWTRIASQTKTVNDVDLDMEVPVLGISDAYYKADFTITLYRNGTSETITQTCYATCP